MTNLQELILSGESDTLDFKKKITSSERIARTIASFANTRGGMILVGVMDNGEVCGIDPEEEKHMLLTAANDFCNPPVKLIIKELKDEDLTVLKVIIPESSSKPHLVKVKENDWRSYIRVKDESVQTSKMVQKVLENESPEKEEAEEVTGIQEKILLEFLIKQKRVTAKQFARLANISLRRANRILVKMVLNGSIRLHDKEKEFYYTIS